VLLLFIGPPVDVKVALIISVAFETILKSVVDACMARGPIASFTFRLRQDGGAYILLLANDHSQPMIRFSEALKLHGFRELGYKFARAAV
jgi:large-conductance mechanosensitive channel